MSARLRKIYDRCCSRTSPTPPVSGLPGREYPEIWGGAWNQLGYFLICMGDAQAAEIPMRRAIECGHPDVVDEALCNLGILLASQPGREREAEIFLRRAIDTAEPPFASSAEARLESLRSGMRAPRVVVATSGEQPVRRRR